MFVKLTSAYNGKPLFISVNEIAAVLPAGDDPHHQVVLPEGVDESHAPQAYIILRGTSLEDGIAVVEAAEAVMNATPYQA